MCGFTGFYDSNYQITEPEKMLVSMGEAIQHRGPDDSGVWYEASIGLGLSHRRLAIVDVSEAGHQPMKSFSNRYTIAFNGEIYNHLELRSELQAAGYSFVWKGHSDTETLLACFDVWGIKDTIKKAVGMFAIALWDSEDSKLSLIRDRVGEKPLYYGWHNDCLLFGSELKAITINPLFKKKIDRNSLTLLLRHNYIPSPHCIWKNTYKLQPGTILTYELLSKKATVETYWCPKKIVEESENKRENVNTLQAVDDLESVLSSAIAKQMAADVPLGAFLSGGIDSSVIVALMQAQSEQPIKTFSIGFHDKKYNEAEHAKLVAEHLKTEHTELYVSPEDALEIVPKLAAIYDEPFADSSGIPTYLVSKMAKEKVTVALSGDAGDELFCGYNRYLMTNSLWSKLKRIPVSIRWVMAKLLLLIPPKVWDSIGDFLHKLFPNKIPAYLGDKIHKGAGVLASNSVRQLYRSLVSLWNQPEEVVLHAQESKSIVSDASQQPVLNSDIELMMAIDMCSYLPDDILVKVDRAAMAVSLETRVPFLDHKLIEYAWKLPMDLKIREGKSKWVLREVLFRHVPRKLIERPKMGFGIPLDSWLRGPLKNWAGELLDESRLRQEGYFEVNLVKEKWEEHQSGKRNWSHHLWTILMFQAWLEEQGEISD